MIHAEIKPQRLVCDCGNEDQGRFRLFMRQGIEFLERGRKKYTKDKCANCMRCGQMRPMAEILAELKEKYNPTQDEKITNAASPCEQAAPNGQGGAPQAEKGGTPHEAHAPSPQVAMG